MSLAKEPAAQNANATARRYSALPVIGNSLLASAIVALIVASSAALSSGGSFLTADRLGDQVSQQDVAARQAAFAAHPAIDLSLVRDAEVPKAVANMSMNPAQQAALLREVVAPVTTVEVSPHAHAAAQAQRLQLAWLTVWDTDADGRQSP